MWEVMFWPLVACILLPGLLVYLGLHVLRREIIFIDIAMAQMASLGTCVAILFHQDLKAPSTFAISLGFTLLGAIIFSVIRKRKSEVPLEAIIGIVYVISTATAVLLLSRAAEGDEQIKNMLVGNILLVSPSEIWKTFGLLTAVGIFHYFFRRQFLMISFEPDKADREGLNIRWWDFLFYASFGLVTTSFVRIAGVLLVFTYLIVPAACGIRLGASFTKRFILGWCISLLGGFAGLFFSFWFDLPSGAAIVCTFGGLMIIVSVWKILFDKGY
jgi:zinc/manganese transport system permease protein